MKQLHLDRLNLAIISNETVTKLLKICSGTTRHRILKESRQHTASGTEVFKA